MRIDESKESVMVKKQISIGIVYRGKPEHTA